MSIPPPLVVLPLLEIPKSPTPPPSPETSEPESLSLPTPPPLTPPAQVFIPSVEIAPPSPEPEPEPLPNRQQIRTLTKDTPSLAADKPKLTPDCKLYWIQKHLEQEQQEEEERARKRKMSLVSSGSANSEVSTEEEEKRQREEEERRREAEEEKRIEEEKKLREEAEKLRLYQEMKAKEDARRRQMEESAKKRKEEEQARLEAERIKKEKEEELKRAAAAEKARLEEEERRKEMEAEAERKKKCEEEEKLRKEREMAEHLITKMSIEDEELKKSETNKEVMKKIKVTGQRSKKPTMAREWRKLKEKQKHSDTHKESLVVEKMEVDTTPEVTPVPPRAKYVPPVFKENETYSDRHKTFLTGSWPHNNKKGIPTPSELAEAGFFFIGPEDYCRSVPAHYISASSLSFQVLPVRTGADVLGTLRESLDQTRLSRPGLFLCGENQGGSQSVRPDLNISLCRAGTGSRRWPGGNFEFVSEAALSNSIECGDNLLMCTPLTTRR